MTKAILATAAVLVFQCSAFAPARAEDGEAPDPPPSVAERFEAIKAEYEAAEEACWKAQKEAKTPLEEHEAYVRLVPDVVAYSRRMIDLASTAPKDPGARDALLWVIHHPERSDAGLFGEEFGRAATRLVRDFGDDPEAVCIGLGLDNLFSCHRDQLLAGFLASAKGHEAKGLARLAFGRYLQRKANAVQGVRKLDGRQTYHYKGIIGDDGAPHDMAVVQSDEDYAYDILLKQCDPDAIAAEAEKLFEEVIRDYGDVPRITHKLRNLQTLLMQPEPKRNGRALTEEELQTIRKTIDSTPSLAKAAEGYLDEIRNVVVGKPAPEIDGVDFDGKPLKLSDYRGKVVALVFWGTWCGPCMQEVPHERELVEKYKGRPFAMLGVDCSDPKAKAAEVMKSEGITWPNWHDGEDLFGPIASLYHVSGFPTIFVIDANGTIRATNTQGDHLDKLVEQLVAEAEGQSTEAGGSR